RHHPHLAYPLQPRPAPGRPSADRLQGGEDWTPIRGQHSEPIDRRIVDRSHEAQQYRASGLNLVIAAIVYWNSTYMADALTHLRSAGNAVTDDLMAHTSPVGWEHIAFSGDFLWDRAAQAKARKSLILPRGMRAA
ncbi:Tn3 family transposase, partial [Agrobacterium vitis]|uniref:Tn3 family transposase n=1 Tax=Agrobacterium vitis TaxID=373 RepID=UPI001F4575FA